MHELIKFVYKSGVEYIERRHIIGYGINYDEKGNLSEKHIITTIQSLSPLNADEIINMINTMEE